jgi:hypothetical protein
MSCGDRALNAAMSSADVETTTESGGDGDDAPPVALVGALVGAAVSVAGGELAQLDSTSAARRTSRASVRWTAAAGRDRDRSIGDIIVQAARATPRAVPEDTYFL